MTKQQIEEANNALDAQRLEPDEQHLCPPQIFGSKPPQTVALEFDALTELQQAQRCLEHGDRSTARIHMERAHELLNEAEIDD